MPDPDVPVWFEIPLADGGRARAFHEGIFARFRDSEGNRVGPWSRR